jgi:hypothetical protein
MNIDDEKMIELFENVAVVKTEIMNCATKSDVSDLGKELGVVIDKKLEKHEEKLHSRNSIQPRSGFVLTKKQIGLIVSAALSLLAGLGVFVQSCTDRGFHHAVNTRGSEDTAQAAKPETNGTPIQD